VALLARGADVDALFEKNNRWLRSDRGISALHLAAQRSDAAAIVAALLAGGADPNRRDRDRRTPLHYAAHLATSLGTVEALLVAGADVNAEDSAGWTPLHLAAASDGASPPIVARLIAFGADTESESDTDQRAIHLAAIHTTSPELLSLLAKAAGTPCPRNGDGANVAEIAAENEHIHGTEIYWQLHEICLDQ
jgi:ankyrin repeat protein